MAGILKVDLRVTDQQGRWMCSLHAFAKKGRGRRLHYAVAKDGEGMADLIKRALTEYAEMIMEGEAG